MMIEVLKSKIHCVTVTEANLNYMGSITIDEDIMDAANMIAGEKVQIVDNNNPDATRYPGFFCFNPIWAQAGGVVTAFNACIFLAFSL